MRESKKGLLALLKMRNAAYELLQGELELTKRDLGRIEGQHDALAARASLAARILAKEKGVYLVYDEEIKGLTEVLDALVDGAGLVNIETTKERSS